MYIWYNCHMLDINTKIGDIHFSENLIKNLIKDAVDSVGPKAQLNNYKGKYMYSSSGNLSNIVIEETEEGWDIVLFIVVSFGASISTVANNIIDKVYSNMEDMLDVKPHSVKVMVTGVASRDIARRKLEFIR